MERIALVIEKTVPVNVVVLAEGKAGDDWLAENPNAVEITGLDPMPGVGHNWTFENGQWTQPPEPPKTKEDIEIERMSQYIEHSDPIFFKWQRGEATEQEWLDAVQAIKDANPYPEAV